MNNRLLLIKICRRLKPIFLNEETYLKVLFFLKMGYKLDLKNPKTHSEKCQWLKLYYRRPEFVTMVDKLAVKDYVAKKIGQEYVIKTLGVWDNPKDIRWENLPQQFVLKTTHGGGGAGVVVCKDKNNLDIEETVRTLTFAMKQDIAKYSCEWMYAEVPRHIIAEQLLVEEGKPSPDDYKVMCFNGEVKLIEYHTGRYSKSHTQDFYDRNWEKTAITQGKSYGETSDITIERPSKLDEMIRLSEILAKGLPHVRVDWYMVNNKLYFGEITFFDGSGLAPWDKYEYDLLMGSWITLPEKIVEKKTKDFGIQSADMFY